MHIGRIIYNYRKENNLSMDNFAKLSGLSKSYIAMLEKNLNPSSGKTIAPTIDIIKKVAIAMSVDFDELFSIMDDDTLINIKPLSKSSDENIYTQLDMSYIKVPLYGDISCGNGSFVDDNVIDYIAVPDDGLNSSKEYFAQIASGDSMIDAGINDGDVIVFEKSNVIDDGKIGCFCIDDNVATCKKFKRGKVFIQLIPANHNYDPIVIDLHDNNFRVIGVLKKSIKSFD